MELAQSEVSEEGSNAAGSDAAVTALLLFLSHAVEAPSRSQPPRSLRGGARLEETVLSFPTLSPMCARAQTVAL